MKITKAKLLKILLNNFEKDKVLENYSGRFMYGNTCIGVIVNDITDLIDIVPKSTLQQAKIDNMGLGKVVYFPNFINK